MAFGQDFGDQVCLFEAELTTGQYGNSLFCSFVIGGRERGHGFLLAVGASGESG